MINCPSCGEENPPKFRLCGYCGTPLAPAPAALPVREMRKTVTLIFSDLKDSTALGERLDSEALHEVKDRYFDAMSAEIKRHGGKIEKFIGDAIMAVFGLPKAHEDDALRAVRAAADMRKALIRVNEDLTKRYGVALGNRTGVNTGEVVANDDEKADQKLATGDAVNVAARLEQAAPVNEIYLGETTYQLVRDAVEVEAVEPLTLKGKSEKVAAYRLVSALGLDGYARREDTPIVGRDDELAKLHDAYHQVCTGQSVHLVTVIGDAGVGKSRLVREVVDQIAAGAHVLRGRCLPYGDGITFWPLLGMVREAAAIRDEDPPALARSKLLGAVGDADVAARMASAVGFSDESFPLHELYWGARKFLEGFAARRPGGRRDRRHPLGRARVPGPAGAHPRRVQGRGDPAAGHLAARPAGKPAAVGPARQLHPAGAAPVEQRGLGAGGDQPARLGRPAGRRGRTHRRRGRRQPAVRRADAVDADRQPCARTSKATPGCAPESYGDINVPPTIRALLEARLDNLARADRATVEPAAVIGQEFERPAIEALAPEAVRPKIAEHLDTLARKHFIDAAGAPDAEAVYRFHHHLVRDTVYNGLLKRTRANLHLGFVRWADKVNADRDRGCEIRGDPRLPPRAGLPLPGRTGAAGRCGHSHRRRRRAAAVQRRTASLRARRHACRQQPVPPRDCFAARRRLAAH